MAQSRAPTKKVQTKKKVQNETVSTKPVEAPVGADVALEEGVPDAPVAQLVVHAKALANDVRALAEPLAKAKVTLADAARLDTLAEALEGAESAWQIAWAKGAPGAVAAARKVLLRGRSDLFEALRVFALNDGATQLALDRIAGVEGDDDLAADAARLVPLARQHAADLDGTEITPAAVDGVEAALKSFGAARAGARGGPDEPTTEQALTESARKARAGRNRAFWTLAGLTRQVCLRGRFAFRHDPSRASKFTGYVRAGRAAKPAEPGPIDPTPPKPQG